MTALGPHASFILAAYLATALVVVVLAGFVIYDARRQRRRLTTLAAQGIQRRSANRERRA